MIGTSSISMSISKWSLFNKSWRFFWTNHMCSLTVWSLHLIWLLFVESNIRTSSLWRSCSISNFSSKLSRFQSYFWTTICFSLFLSILFVMCCLRDCSLGRDIWCGWWTLNWHSFELFYYIGSWNLWLATLIKWREILNLVYCTCRCLGSERKIWSWTHLKSQCYC